MRIWLIGAGRAGSAAIRQLQKNDRIEIVVSDPLARPKAVEEGLIQQVDLVERVTPVNVNEIAKRIHPDLILIASGTGTQSFGNVAGGIALAEGLYYEIAAGSNCPCLVLSRSNLT
ncbi:hypothetical protein KFU94_11000 [Chloroflexi bacterium TSY]|nr:hypothetical protein [Chloroflexi bacterium TSY]